MFSNRTFRFGCSAAMCFSSVRLGGVKVNAGRRFSSSAKNSKYSFGNMVSYVSENRQQFINLLGIYFILSMSVNNFRVEKQHKEKIASLDIAEKTLKTQSELLVEDAWVASVIDKVNKAKDKKEAMRKEIESRLDHIDYVVNHAHKVSSSSSTPYSSSQSSSSLSSPSPPAVVDAKVERII